jgi:ABC-type multidrug transport system ATPase subunit
MYYSKCSPLHFRSGLNGEARKRVTIGVELVTNPLLLFMDEPTSGLDTAGALSVLKVCMLVFFS